MALKIIHGNLLKSKEKYICHQLNCVTKHAAFLAKSVFENFPYSDVYSERKTNDNPGEIIVRGNGLDQRYIIGIFGQYYPGKPKYSNDNSEKREQYFQKALDKILEIPSLDSIAFPFAIGCGAAGGNWKNYLKMITCFSEKTKAEVIIYEFKRNT